MKLSDKTNSIIKIRVDKGPLRHRETALRIRPGIWPSNRAAVRSPAAVANMIKSGVLSGPLVCEKSMPKRKTRFRGRTET
jgi:hypothetical protein